MSVPRALSILRTPGSIPASLDILVNSVRDHFGLGGLKSGDESPHFAHVPLVVLLVSDVNDTGLFVFVHVKRMSVFNAPKKLVLRQRSVKVTLPFSFGDASQKPAFRERDSLCPRFPPPATPKGERDANGRHCRHPDCSWKADGPSAQHSVAHLKCRSAKFHDISEPKLELIENGIDAYAGSLADVDKNKKVDHHCRPRELVNSLLIIPARRNTIHGAGLAQICVRTAIGDPAAARRRSRLEILL